jgi:hypothetical protein
VVQPLKAHGANRPGFRTVVHPWSDHTHRPLWSVMIPSYNCSGFLRETLLSVLSQDPGAELMQIEVVDDHSVDRPDMVVGEVGGGRVAFFQQSTRVGHIENFSTCLNRSRGRLIHLLHGDDLVRAGFYRKAQEAFRTHPEIGAFFCRQIFADEEGHWTGISRLERRESGIVEDWPERLASEQRIMTPSIVVRRDVYERLGGFDRRLVCGEDWEMWIRVASEYPIWYEVEPLAVYRMHWNSNTGRHARNAEDMRYTRMAIDLFESYLPEDRAREIVGKARETYALTSLWNAEGMARRGDWSATAAQMREALLFSRTPRVGVRAVLTLARSAASAARSLLSSRKHGLPQ